MDLARMRVDGSDLDRMTESWGSPEKVDIV